MEAEKMTPGELMRQNYKKLYRFESDHENKPLLHEFKIIKRTPKGYWISIFLDTKKWVSETGRKRYAYPIYEEAYLSYLYRKMRYVENCKFRLKDAETQYSYAKSDERSGRFTNEIERLDYVLRIVTLSNCLK